jgi:hypothetical protein
VTNFVQLTKKVQNPFFITNQPSLSLKNYKVLTNQCENRRKFKKIYIEIRKNNNMTTRLEEYAQTKRMPTLCESRPKVARSLFGKSNSQESERLFKKEQQYQRNKCIVRYGIDPSTEKAASPERCEKAARAMTHSQRNISPVDARRNERRKDTACLPKPFHSALLKMNNDRQGITKYPLGDYKFGEFSIKKTKMRRNFHDVAHCNPH